MTKGYYTSLNDRGAVLVSGPDTRDFLQGLVTQDVGLLTAENPLLYSLLLNAQGRIHFDFFMWNQGDSILLETEKARAPDLLARLRMFTLRKNVTLKLQDVQVIAAWDTDDTLKAFSYQPDPRLSALGLRKITTEPSDNAELNGLESTSENIYHRLCVTNTVPNGSRDIAWESDTVADLGIDQLNAVSHAKGCYLGQELTSRMHHRGLSKRGLYTVEIQGDAQRPFTDLLADGNLIGEMRSSDGNMGLAVLRHDSLDLAPKAGLKAMVKPVAAAS